MFNELWDVLKDPTLGLGTGGGDSWLTTLITALGVIGAASIAAFAGTFRRHPEPSGRAQTSGLVRELRRRAVTAETRSAYLENENRRLTEFLLRWDVDPHTGERLVDPV